MLAKRRAAVAAAAVRRVRGAVCVVRGASEPSGPSHFDSEGAGAADVGASCRERGWFLARNERVSRRSSLFCHSLLMYLFVCAYRIAVRLAFVLGAFASAHWQRLSSRNSLDCEAVASRQQPRAHPLAATRRQVCVQRSIHMCVALRRCEQEQR